MKYSNNLQVWATSWQNQQSDCAPSEDSDQPWHPPSLISLRCALNGYLRSVKTLIRLGRCPDWSESSLGAHAISLVLSWGGSSMYSCPTSFGIKYDHFRLLRKQMDIFLWKLYKIVTSAPISQNMRVHYKIVPLKVKFNGFQDIFYLLTPK